MENLAKVCVSMYVEQFVMQKILNLLTVFALLIFVPQNLICILNPSCESKYLNENRPNNSVSRQDATNVEKAC